MELENIFPTTEASENKREGFLKSSDEEKQESIERDHKRALLENQKNFFDLSSDIAIADPALAEDIKLTFEIAKVIKENGGIALVLGGFVRDTILRSIGFELDSKDIDIEVYGIESEKLRKILENFGTINLVGSSFGVLKLGDLDISMPRSDIKTGNKQNDFDVEIDPNMLLAEATRRRDLTINALAMDPLTGEVIDPHGGIDDILERKLRATDPKRFIEDPLRVLRVVQFAGRFEFEVEEETKKLCIQLVRSGSMKHLSVERFEKEWNKLLLKSKRPSFGLSVAREIEIVNLYPELKALIDCPQEYEWHPEGDVWTHTLMVVDEAKRICERENLNERDSLVLMFAALCHDFGKPKTTTTQEKKGQMRITSEGHEMAGAEPTENFLKSINLTPEIIKEIIPLVKEHLFPSTFKAEVTDPAIRKLAKRLYPTNIKSLVRLGEADAHGRGVWSDQPHKSPTAKPWAGYPSGELLLSRAGAIKDLSPETPKITQYITGKTLIGLGLKPGTHIGKLLKELDTAQEEGKIEGPDDLRLAKLYVELFKALQGEISTETLLTGDSLNKEDMADLIKERFLSIGTHDMGTLCMYLQLTNSPMPKTLIENYQAILTAHQHGPAWFKHFDKNFYNTSWKSFYGAFEVDIAEQTRLSRFDILEQTKIALDLINNPDQIWIDKYNESYSIKPTQSEGKIAYYSTNLYPFEAGMMDGFEIMVQFIPAKNRLCISIMNEDPNTVKSLDSKIRSQFPEFAKARKIGYLFAENENGEDNVFSEDDARRVFNTLTHLRQEIE